MCESSEPNNLKMSSFESVFIPLENAASLHHSRKSRFKMGEIFQCEKSLELVCIHCSTEFTDFLAFCDHAQLHLMDICSQVSMSAKSRAEVECVANSDETTVDEVASRAGALNVTCKTESKSSDSEGDMADAIEFDSESSNDSAENGEITQCPLCAQSFSTVSCLQTHLQDDHKRMYAAGTFKFVDGQPGGGEAKKLKEVGTPLLPCTKEEYSSVQKKLRSEGFELDNSTQAFEFFKYIYDFDEMNADSIDLYQCPKCSHTCKQMAKMRTHIFKHLQKNIFVCIECKRCFKSVGAIRQHVKKLHSSKKTDIAPKKHTSIQKTMRTLRNRKKDYGTSRADWTSSSESSSSSDEDSEYEPKRVASSDECTDDEKAEIERVPDDDVWSDNGPEEVEQNEVILTSDDFQQHSKAQAKFKQKYIEISDTPAAIEYAKYALMSDFKYSASSFQCPKCPHSCSKYMEMRRHIFTHLREKIFTCMFCRRKSNWVVRIESHVSDHMRNNTKKLSERLSEMNTDIPNDSPNRKIDKQLAIVRRKLNRHCIQLDNSTEGIKYAKYYLMYDIKTKDGHFECPQCYALFLSRNSFRKHLFRHIKADIFFCMICQEKYSAYELIRRHMKLKHSKHINAVNASAGAEAPVSIKAAYTEEDEVTDIAAKSVVRRVLCTICGASVKANGLKRHVNIHERKADFKCDLCDKAFLRKCKLLEHRRSHPEPMPHHCEICNKGYILKRGLVRHLTTHGKES